MKSTRNTSKDCYENSQPMMFIVFIVQVLIFQFSLYDVGISSADEVI